MNEADHETENGTAPNGWPWSAPQRRRYPKMPMVMYTLVDRAGGNLVGSYATQDEALADIREDIALNGRDNIYRLGLFDEARSRYVVSGRALADMAEQRAKSSA